MTSNKYIEISARAINPSLTNNELAMGSLINCEQCFISDRTAAAIDAVDTNCKSSVHRFFL